MIIQNLLTEVPRMAVGNFGCEKASVFLNGEYQDKCVFADAERGLIERIRVDENNKIMYEPITNKPLWDIIYGKVKIIVYYPQIKEQ